MGWGWGRRRSGSMSPSASCGSCKARVCSWAGEGACCFLLPPAGTCPGFLTHHSGTHIGESGAVLLPSAPLPGIQDGWAPDGVLGGSGNPERIVTARPPSTNPSAAPGLRGCVDPGAGECFVSKARPLRSCCSQPRGRPAPRVAEPTRRGAPRDPAGKGGEDTWANGRGAERQGPGRGGVFQAGIARCPSVPSERPSEAQAQGRGCWDEVI